MSDFWSAILFLHLLGMAFFVGGQLVVGVAVVPALRAAPDNEQLRGIARRFGIGTLVALVILLATGIAMASHDHRWSSGTLQLKLGLVAVTLVLVFAHLRRPGLHALQAATLVSSLAIVWLGVQLAD